MLDELSGFEFESLMVDVFRELGYENVRLAERSADMGRDVLMEEVVDGTHRLVIVECKHTSTVGRPVVQKLHSGISTYDYDGPKRGLIATTGRYTGPAKEYAGRLQENDDKYSIKLIDGRDLRDIADEVGLDLKNGRIEILCDETLRPYEHPDSVYENVTQQFRDIENIDESGITPLETGVVFRPVVDITTETNAVFETSVGVIHRINERNRLVIHADRGETTLCDTHVSELVTNNFDTTVELDEASYSDAFDSVETKQYGMTQTEYKEWSITQLKEYHTTTVTYTGDNNVTYNKTCTPNDSDITVQDIKPVYLPEIETTTELQEYSYPYEYYAAGPSRVTNKDGIHRCVHCETSGKNKDYTYCDNCGSINCSSHIKTERLEQTPVCTGCAVTDRFFFKTKYFYNEDNLEKFREQYSEMPFYRKALENKILTASGIITILITILSTLIYLQPF